MGAKNSTIKYGKSSYKNSVSGKGSGKHKGTENNVKPKVNKPWKKTNRGF